MMISNIILAFVFASGVWAADKKHWSFQPVKRVAVPAKSNPIDYFIGRKLRENSLTSSPKADRITLLRRATLDMTRLPPSPESVKKFVEDPRTTEIAFAEAVEGLLASPRYGERGAQHWLDVVRYADTAGENCDMPVDDAWRFRNYVIHAFNKDTPFDRFIREQLAGDIMSKSGTKISPERYSELITATGYLAISRRHGHDAKKDH